MASWRYLAQRVDADGFGPLSELPVVLEGTQFTEQMSAPPLCKTRTSERVRDLVDEDGAQLFGRWATAIYAEADEQIRSGYLLRDYPFSADGWSLDLVGFTGYAKGMPFDGSQYFIDEDPLNIFRHIWTHLQSQPGGNLALQLDGTTSPVRVGKQIENVEFVTGAGEQVAFEAGPRKLNYWQTHDLAKEIDDYAKETPFDWLESHAWAASGDSIDHFVRTGYPRIGSRRNDVTGLVYEQNVLTPPPVAQGEYCNAVIALGAGEGRDQIRGYAGVTDPALRRVKVVEDKSKRSIKAANAYAEAVLARARGEFTMESIAIRQHDNLDIWGIQLGDELPYYAETEQGTFDLWVRVVGRTTSPDDEDTAVLTVVNPEAEML